jgi:hypothetical protein
MPAMGVAVNLETCSCASTVTTTAGIPDSQSEDELVAAVPPMGHHERHGRQGGKSSPAEIVGDAGQHDGLGHAEEASSKVRHDVCVGEGAGATDKRMTRKPL